MARFAYVDDEENMRKAVERTFIRHYRNEHSLDLYPSGPEFEQSLNALDQLYVHVLLDVRMPGKSGIEVAKGMRERGDETPVTFVTGTPQDLKGVDITHMGILDKPFTSQQIREIVEKALID
jgi:FixJ family two-component response regulator